MGERKQTRGLTVFFERGRERKEIKGDGVREREIERGTDGERRRGRGRLCETGREFREREDREEKREMGRWGVT